jgi:hypothetical protein
VDKTGIGQYVGEAAELVDPTPTIYELTTGKDWDTGEKLSGYDRYVEPFLEYLITKKLVKAKNSWPSWTRSFLEEKFLKSWMNGHNR